MPQSHVSSYVVGRLNLAFLLRASADKEKWGETGMHGETVDTLDEPHCTLFIKEIRFFRPACISAEAFALQHNATEGRRG